MALSSIESDVFVNTSNTDVVRITALNGTRVIGSLTVSDGLNLTGGAANLGGGDLINVRSITATDLITGGGPSSSGGLTLTGGAAALGAGNVTTTGTIGSGTIGAGAINSTGVITAGLGFDASNAGIARAGLIQGALGIESTPLTALNVGAVSGGVNIGQAGQANTLTGISTSITNGAGNSVAVDGAGTTVSGVLTANGATQINNTLGVTGNLTATGATNSLLGDVNNLTATGEVSQNNISAATNTITGTTNINTGVVAGPLTTIGNVANGNGNLILQVNGATNITGSTTLGSLANSTNTIGAFGSLNTVTGATNNINGSSSSNLNSGANYVHVVAPGEGSSGVTAIGNGATLTMNGQNASLMNSANTPTAGLQLNGAGNTSLNGAVNSIGTSQAGSANTIGTTGSTNTINGAVNNIGTNQASTNTIGTAGSNNTLVGTTNLVSNNGSSQVQVNDNGVNVIGNTASVQGRDSAQISGGSTSLTLNNNGASFSQNGAPVRVTGVANGVNPYDAVNKSQLDMSTNGIYSRIGDLQSKAYSGIASVAAMASIPEPTAGHNYTVGIGYGNFGSQSAVAFGGKANVGDSVRVAANLGYAGSELTVGLGTGFSW